MTWPEIVEGLHIFESVEECIESEVGDAIA